MGKREVTAVGTAEGYPLAVFCHKQLLIEGQSEKCIYLKGMISMTVLNVVVVGACGKMGKEVLKGFLASGDIKIAGAIDVNGIGQDVGEIIGVGATGVKVTDNITALLGSVTKPCVVIDFTIKAAAIKNIPIALGSGASVVVGTTGFTQQEMDGFDTIARQNKVGILIAPNFSLGAVLMMKCAKDISRYLKQVEIIEYHNDKKVDSPSGTAIATTLAMKDNLSLQQDGVINENNCRGGDFNGVRVHSVRLKSMVAHQEVLFAGEGELLTIRHDSFSRESFIPGVLMAVRKIGSWQGLKYGLDLILD